MSDAHTLDPTILREYDIRGVVGETLNPDDLEAIGRAFGTLAVAKGAQSVAVGYDGRTTSIDLEAALVRGLASTGLNIKRIGLGPSPMLYFATHFLETDAGCMITGSHNPPEYNGIKMSLLGKSFFGADIQELGRVAAAGAFATGRGKISDHEILDDYVARILRDYGGGRALKVAWDAGNGAAGDALVKVVAGLPGEHILLNETIDGTFPAHHPDPTVEKNLDQLKAAVAEHGCDLGFAFDGDGDRIGLVDGLGRVLWGDQILLILAGEVLENQPGAAIIADVKASQVLFDEVKRLGGRPVMWKTGHSLIKTKMAEEKSPLAGEMSAHIFFADKFYGHDDALYAAVRLLSILACGETSLADMRDAMPQTVSTPEIRFDCDEDRKFAVIDEVKARLGQESGITVHDMDGVRVETADGWWLLRASNTQAVLVARCESSDDAGLDRLKAQLSDQLRQSHVAVPDLG